MKKFLYLARYYPPISSIASMRSWKLAKYIGDFGWEPIVIAADEGDVSWHCPLPDVSVYRLAHRTFFGGLTKNVKKSLSNDSKSSQKDQLTVRVGESLLYKTARLFKRCLSEVAAYPDVYGDWKKKALACGSEVIRKERPEAILSTSGPYSSHIVADQLSREFGIPWIADYRDLWNGNPSYSRTPVRRFFELRLEKNILESALRVVSVSKPLADELSDFLGRPVEVITNGFDQDDYDVFYSTREEPGAVFSIVYTGVIYRGKRDPEPLFKAIDLLLERKMIDSSKIKVFFWGADPKTMPDVAMSKELKTIVSFNERISVERSIEEQVKASVLLFLSWTDLSQKGFFTGKIFEYLGARRPILAIPENPDSVVDKLIKDTSSGVICSDPERIAKEVKKWYDEFYETGKVSYDGVEEEIVKYDRRNQAKQFADLLDSLV